MNFPRRQFLQVFSYAAGSSLILPRDGFAAAAQGASPAPPADAKQKSGGTEMEKVAGIGGLFFRARDPKALGNWYLQHLGISLSPSGEGGTVWQQEAGPTVFSPFPEKTGYF